MNIYSVPFGVTLSTMEPAQWLYQNNSEYGHFLRSAGISFSAQNLTPMKMCFIVFQIKKLKILFSV